MKRGFYLRLAVENIRKHGRLYIPRILAEAGLLGCFYIMITLAMDERMSEALGGAYLSAFMVFGAVVIGLLSLILILYVNGFLLKQRKGEYGLYNVLGMEKRHIVRVLFCESCVASALSILLGLCFGALFYKACSLLICRLMRARVVAGFYYLNATTLLFPAAVFLALDALAFLIGGVAIHRMKPVELLAGRHTGEKEPKVKWLLLALGVITLGTGYYIALTTQSPLEAILLFFAAVILVIIGTYCLYVTGTTFVLKGLKRNRRYYYDPRHMPAVSGLLFRMKQNAVGLASIAVLATGVLCLISTTVSLYAGVEDTLNATYPRQLYLSAYRQDGDVITHFSSDRLTAIVARAAEESGLEIEGTESERFLNVSYLMEGNALLTREEAGSQWNLERLTDAIYITEDTYTQLRGQRVTLTGPKTLDLKDDEIAFCRIATTVNNIGPAPKTLTVGGREYAVKTYVDYFPVQGHAGTVVNVVGVVVANDGVLNDIYRAQKAAYGEYASEFSSRIGVSFADGEAAGAAGDALDRSITEQLKAECPEGLNYTLDTRWETERNLLDMFGTFLFLGILLGFVCLFSTVLIIYYKQISEGYDDRERFQIMQKIGMEAQEVKKVIGSQLVLQFFLPLATAALHTAVAFPILLKLLRILMLANTGLFVVCTIITFAVFALAYVTVYLLTARTYYKIVR